MFGWTNNPIIVSTNYPQPNAASSTTFSFVGKFQDVNIAQTYGVRYKRQGKNDTTEYITFKKIKSLFYPNSVSSSCPNLQPNQSSISADICQIVNRTISFSNVQWSTYGENPAYCFGSITSYEYQLPAGWSIGSNTSTGSNWIAGGNSVTVTSDQTTGNGSYIRIRPANSCATGLSNGYTPAQVYVTRPEPPLSISGPTQLCFPNSYNYTLSGVPSGGVVTWNTSSYYSISASGNTASISPNSAANGGTNITASVYLPSCGLTFTKSFPVSIGAPYVTFNIVSYPYEEPSCYEVYGIYTFQAQQATGYPNTYTGFDWGWRNLTTSAVSNDPTIYGSQYTFFPEEAGTYEIWVRPTNQCGSGALESVKTVTVNNFCSGFRSSSSNSTITTYPNPAKDIINLTVTTDVKTEKQTVKNKIIVELYESITASKVKEWKFDSQQKTYSLSIRGLKKGIYYLRYINGDDRKTKQIIIE